MLLEVNTKSLHADRVRGARLQDFGLDERNLQEILFRSLDRLFPDDELILLMQSRRWQEEPDLMAIDQNGSLYIFELKVWEASSEHLLQVLRYGQIYGSSRYEDLDRWFQKRNTGQTLAAAFMDKFGVELAKQDYNKKQVFILITNGVDYTTREAIQYWQRSHLDVRPWVYRVYRGTEAQMLLEIAVFRVGDNPYEDLAEGYYMLNTNTQGGDEDHEDMLQNKKAAAYFDPWKYKIERLAKGDVIFLYQSGVGIVAVGEADGKLEKRPYHGNPENDDEEYCRKLNHFQRVDPPVTAREIKELTEVDWVFRQTMFGLDEESGKKLRQFIVDKRLAE
jgi:hypothetical protein